MMNKMPLIAAALALAACGGEKKAQSGGEQKAEPKAEAPAPGAVTPDPVSQPATGKAPAVDTMKPAAPDTSKAASKSAKSPSGPLRDSAFGPKFTVDEKTGKVTPIKKTP